MSGGTTPGISPGNRITGSRRSALLLTAIALLLASLGFGLLEYGNQRSAMTQRLGSLSRVMAANTGDAVSRGDRHTASQMLRTLGAEPDVYRASLLLADGSLFAGETLGGTEPVAESRGNRAWLERAIAEQRATHLFGNAGLELIAPVMQGQEVVGFLHLQASLHGMDGQITRLAGLLGAMLLLLMGGIYAISGRLDRRNPAPDRAFTADMPAMADSGDDTQSTQRSAYPPLATPKPTDLLDAAAIERLRQIGTERGRNVLGRVAGLFLEAAPELLAKLRDSVGNADFAAARRTAHSLRSSSANLGAMTLSARCAVLESAAGDGNREALQALMAEVESAAAVAFAAIRDLNTTPAPMARLPAATPGTKHILVVDDDRAFRLATLEVLHAEGFAASEAGSGGQALAMLSAAQPDLILLEATMADMDGFETCQRLRQLATGKDVPVIMVTDLDDAQSVERAFHVGATGFTSKSVSYPLLVQRIRFMLRASENESELRDHKAMLQIAQRVARLAYWRWDPVTDRFEMSENLCDMCGVTRQEFHGNADAFLQFVCEEDRERVGMRLHGAMHEHQLEAFDYRIRTQNDRAITVQQDLELIPTAGGFHLLGTVQDVTRQRESEDQIRKMAYYDALTGLASRSHLMQHLEDMIKAARRRQEHFSILFLDLDGFKDVNDSLGHDVGDFMLVGVAKRLQKVIRDIDFVARLGGDEFCILLDDNGDDLDAAEVAARCLEVINQPIEFGNQMWRPHVSIGVARFPEDGDTAGLLLKAADSAMYAAKQAGKHRYAFYRPEMTEEAEQRLANEQLVRHAIEHDQFEVHYQPQVDLASGRIVGAEALARWRHPQGGMAMPAEFVPTLERIGLIRNLGTWVIETACMQAAAWIRAGLPEIRVAVNISPLHFHDQGILESVDAALRKSGLPPPLLEIEITERSVQSDAKAMLVLQQLQALGVRISVDDFGTGYSSLGSLKHLPINSLKIDRVFVADMLENSEDAVMLGTIIGLAHALNYTVVAEGVEEHDQATVLAGLQCDLAQGYYFSRPVTAAEVPALLGRAPFFSAAASSEQDHGALLARVQDA